MDWNQNTVQVEISAEHIERLILDGHLCASQVKCLNSESKQKVWQMCLNICGKKMCRLHCLQTSHSTIETQRKIE
ncbi:hypothetical protein BCT86_02960 [Vibrio breoganii]|uniref:Uncharacterized protein n=1 Tax=Vibrio breoganii TaxID=553239 RepID=A0AAN1CRL6_9VIBR|nr:hypothetical protein A6E01_04750 [Vibrio breoganii]PMG79493.1 hypothetical protein BCU83_13340 [Vibrio breoganii]PMK43823.1 hypothetical protein BCU00_10435 [Vibrio breoganii]PML02788.1 hypothetical protein BCT86_02960 [Vibrio breoganii]PMO34159.1 hypothetical protein BCT12_14870 [Vibrio breoganii]